MRARFGKWPEKLQPTVGNHRNELLPKEKETVCLDQQQQPWEVV